VASTLSPPGPVEDLLSRARPRRPVDLFSGELNLQWHSRPGGGANAVRTHRARGGGHKHGGRQAPLIELPHCRESPDARESLCSSIGTKPERPFDRRNNRGGGVVAPGEGRPIFGPPVGPFLPALISATENRDSAPCKPGSLNSRGAPSRRCLWPLIEAADFVSPRWSLSRLTGNRLLAVSCRRLPLCLVFGIESAGSQFLCCIRMSTQASLDLVENGLIYSTTPRPGQRKLKLRGGKGRAFGVRPCPRTPPG
jgi:hypothetical protein